MLSKQFVITLREDTVISQSAVTTGGHSGLDYLSGSALLGAVAKHLYEPLNKQSASLAWDVFHSGKVRFGNALPISEEGYAGYPVPRSWFRDKTDYYCKPLRQHADNYVALTFDRDIRVDQYKGEYCTLAHNDADLFAPDLHYRMKTAIDPANGLAAESQLFGYSSLSAGTRFSFYLEADNERGITEDQFEQIVDVLLHESIFLGRSRSAEYGAVNIKAIENQEVREQPDKEATSLTLWLLADAVIYNAQGMPTLQADARSIGLPDGWELAPEKTFVFSRRYAPYNAHYHRRELEREALGMGSVLHFIRSNEDVDLLTIEQLETLQQQGIGSYHQAGLGRIQVNPSILEDDKPLFGVVDKIIDKKSKFIPAPDCLVLRYLDYQANQAGENERLNNRADTWAQELKGLYKAAKQLVPYVEGGCIGPSATQWGRVMDLSRSLIENPSDDVFDDLFSGLFSKSEGICKPQDIQWNAQVVVNVDQDNAKLSSFRDWLIEKTREIKTDHDLPEIIVRFARLAVNIAQQQSCQYLNAEREV